MTSKASVIALVLLLLCAPAWAAVAYVDKAYAERNTASGSLNVTVPAHTAGDLIFVLTSAGKYNTTNTFSGGSLTWTGETAYGYQLFSTYGCYFRVFWAIGDSGSASGFTGTFSVSPNTSQIVIVAIFSGTDETDATGVSTNVDRGSDSSPAITQTTGVTSGSWNVPVFCGFSNTSPSESGTPSNTTLIHNRQLAGATSAGMAYDTTGTSSETYEWTGFYTGANTHHAVYEILEGAAAGGATTMVISAEPTVRSEEMGR